jgi:hypothetical protein
VRESPAREGWPSRSCHGEGNRLHRMTGEVQDAPGVRRRACDDSLEWNRRGPNRQPSSGRAAPISRRRKGVRDGRESEGPIVPLTPGETPEEGRGNPYFDRACGWR